jgi:transposase-like protein
MLGHGAKFEQKMQQAIAALLSHRSVEQAANEVGISATTLQRWMKEAEFQAELRKARRTAFSQAIGRLQDAAGAATSTLLRIMTDSNASAATRLRAIEIVLEQGAKAASINDLDDRVTKLERSAHSAEITWLNSEPLPEAAPSRAQIAAPGGCTREVDEEVIE